MIDEAVSEKLTDQMEALLSEQIMNWPLCQTGYSTLDAVESKTLDCGDYHVKVQLNPGRIKSATAKVDKESIVKRACFLCHHNRTPEQKGIIYKDDYIILCNPAPIFNNHFTVAHVSHVPQYAADHLNMMFEFSRDLDSHYTLIYNGPQSGASAPDHFHLQAFPSHLMPIEKDAQDRKRLETISDSIAIIRGYDRTVFALTSDDYHEIIRSIELIFRITTLVLKTETEPLINIIVTYQREHWLAILFLRFKHRPDCYFEEGEKRMIVSPGTVDMGGIIITPRREDFDRFTGDFIRGVFQEVSLSEALFEEIIDAVKKDTIS